MLLLVTNVIRCGGRFGSFAFAEGLASCVGAKANVPNVLLGKIELKKMCGGENKKYRRVGNEFRLSCCLVAIWSVCWSLSKLAFHFMFIVVCLFVVVSSFKLAFNYLIINIGILTLCLTESTVVPKIKSLTPLWPCAPITNNSILLFFTCSAIAIAAVPYPTEGSAL